MTNSISEVKSEVLSALKASTMLTDLDIIGEFNTERRTALHKPVLAVGIEKIELAPAGLGSYFGDGSFGQAYSGAWATITLSFDCYTDSANKTQNSQLIFERLAQQLLELKMGITEISSSPIVKANGPFTAKLSATAKLQTIVAASKPKHFVNDFMLKRSDL